MADPVPLLTFLTKLARRTPFSAEERDAILALPVELRSFAPHSVALKEGSPARHCMIVVSGFVSRQRGMNGERQIVSFCVPGDAVDLQSLWFETVDHSAVTHTAAVLAFVLYEDLLALCDRYPTILKALWRDTLIDASVFREWTVNVGHRRAPQRIAHLLLELVARLGAIGLAKNDTIELPFTQKDLADALGLSLVHYNKSLAALRADGVVVLRNRAVHLPDKAALAKLAGFDERYLHLSPDPQSTLANPDLLVSATA